MSSGVLNDGDPAVARHERRAQWQRVIKCVWTLELHHRVVEVRIGLRPISCEASDNLGIKRVAVRAELVIKPVLRACENIPPRLRAHLNVSGGLWVPQYLVM